MYAPQAVFTPGITQPGMQNLEQGIAAFGQGFRQLSKQKKAADALYAALAPEPGQDGSQAANPIMPKEKWDLLGAQDKIAAVGGYVKKTALDSAVQEMKLRNLAIQDAISRQAAKGQLPGAIQAFIAPDNRTITPNQMAGMAGGAGPVAAGPANALQTAVQGGDVNQPLTATDRINRLTPQMMQAVGQTPVGNVLLKAVLDQQARDNPSPLDLLKANTEAKRGDAYAKQVAIEEQRANQTSAGPMYSDDGKMYSGDGGRTWKPLKINGYPNAHVVQANGMAWLEDNNGTILTKPTAGNIFAEMLNPGGSTPTGAPGSAPARTVKDNSGKTWIYTGTMADPKADRDPSHWKAQ